MKVFFDYNKKYHLVLIILGIILGLILGNFFMKQFDYNVFDYNLDEMQKTYTDMNIQMSNEQIIENLKFIEMLIPYQFMFLIGGIFNGTYLFVSYIKSKPIIYKVLSIIMFPVIFGLSSFNGILLLVPLIIYDIYYLLKNRILVKN